MRIDTRGAEILSVIAVAGLATAAQAQMFTNVTGASLDCAGGCDQYKLDPLMECIHPGLCLPNADNFCDQPIHMIAPGAVGDFNNDGFQDIFLPAGGYEADRLYINNGDGTFTDEAASWGVDALHIGAAVAVGDYDDDGWLDIFMSGFGTADGPVLGGHHLLYRNLEGTGFEEVGEAAGVSSGSPNCTDAFGAAFGDYDLDGDLDLCVAGWVDYEAGTRLFQNNGDGTFTDVTDSVPTLNDPKVLVRGFSPRFIDMNGDLWPELLLTCDFGDGAPVPSRYFVNNGDGTFTDATDADGSGLGLDQNGMGHDVADFDGDGLLDWFVTNIFDPEGKMHGWPSARTGNKLYLNDGDDTFTEIAQGAGVDDGSWGWGTVAVDVDHDGDPDIVETNGFKGFGGMFNGIPLYLYLNDGTGMNFDSLDSGVHGLSHGGFGRGLCGFDYDNDGDQDILNVSWNSDVRVYRNNLISNGEVPGDAGYLRVFVDTSDDPGCIAPNGIGTQFVATADNGLVQRVPLDAGDNYLSQSELSAHFGLGDATEVTELLIEWPNGIVGLRKNIPVNDTITIRFCRGDWNGDGDQNILDLVAYSEDWIAQLPAADMDDNGVYNVLDFITWQAVYVKCLNGN